MQKVGRVNPALCLWSATTCNLSDSSPIRTPCAEKIFTQRQYPARFANLTKGAAVIAAIKPNQIFKKGKHKYENQVWHQSRPPRPADYPWLKNNGPKGAGSGRPAANSQRKEKAIMKIKTNVKAGEGDPPTIRH
jgi:hypothetical protein